MAESPVVLEERLRQVVVAGFRGRLVDRGLARGLIWSDGVLPEGAPAFRASLTADLLDYGYAVLAMALRLRRMAGAGTLLERAFLVAGEAIEAAVHRGDPARGERGIDRVSAAVAFHLAGYAARAYSILPNSADRENLAAAERGLVHLLRRRFDELHRECGEWLLDPRHSDAAVAGRLREDFNYGGDAAVADVLTAAFYRGIALLDGALLRGDATSADLAIGRLRLGAEAAADLRSVSLWRDLNLAEHLAVEIWTSSLHARVPVLPDDSASSRRWNELRRDYIQRLHAQSRAAVDLWPSQFEAARRATDPQDSLVVALPTGAGKTRIAELCILRALASGSRALYVTPLRALSAQVERDLSETFAPLGIEVSSLYGSAGVSRGDQEVLGFSRVVVSTPEKLDFALRNNPSIIDDVGLVVLDEGHMLGPSDREVRYEALVQRLLRRQDAPGRRIVCLSAMFPEPEQMEDLVSWIRRDVPGSAVYSSWRPTRQRFGALTWQGASARLEVSVGEERPFVQHFVRAGAPPRGSGRRRRFPASKNELTLAAAWRFVRQGKTTLVFCSMRRSVESLGELIVDSFDRGLLEGLKMDEVQFATAASIGEEWLGRAHPAVRCLGLGVVLHHGHLPRPYLSAVEDLVQKGACRLVVASPTLAQGINLPATVVLVPSLWRDGRLIPAAELANVAGRAGRPFVDLEGLILHVNFERAQGQQAKRSVEWRRLVREARAPEIKSGILLLATSLMLRISTKAAVPFVEVLEYLANGEDRWGRLDLQEMGPTGEERQWASDMASLDTALLALLDAEIDSADIAAALDEALQGSLLSKQLARSEAHMQLAIRGFLEGRARSIWEATSRGQRLGYFAAGVGYSTGRSLDAVSERLVRALIRAEVAILDRDAAAAADAVVEFAEIAFGISPFGSKATEELNWRPALRAWVLGSPSAEVLKLAGARGVELLQDAFSYRLPWAMEAARVHGLAIGEEAAELLEGKAALAAEVGSVDPSVTALVRAGFSSREGAAAAVSATGAAFVSRAGLIAWLQSVSEQGLAEREDWPTEGSRLEWLRFVEAMTARRTGPWSRSIESVGSTWTGDAPEEGTPLVLWPTGRLGETQILNAEWAPIGMISGRLSRPAKWVVGVKSVGDARSIEVEYFGPLM